MWEAVDTQTVESHCPPSLSMNTARQTGMDGEFPVGSTEASLTYIRDTGLLAAEREGRWRRAGAQNRGMGREPGVNSACLQVSSAFPWPAIFLVSTLQGGPTSVSRWWRGREYCRCYLVAYITPGRHGVGDMLSRELPQQDSGVPPRLL